jgi:hypothetical protein
MSRGQGRQVKFETLCGRMFESSTALADYLGVTVGAITHARTDARARGRTFFECGKPLKRYIKFIERGNDDSHDGVRPEEDSVRDQTSKHKTPDPDVQPNMFEIRPAIVDSLAVGAMKVMHVHAHIQAAALKRFPGKKMCLADTSLMPTKKAVSYITVCTDAESKTNNKVRFDLAQTWMLHSPSSAGSASEFRRALEGTGGIFGYILVCEELSMSDRGKYPSLVFSRQSRVIDDESETACAAREAANDQFCNKYGSFYRPYMDADDVLTFLLSKFARKGRYNDIFEGASFCLPEINQEANQEITQEITQEANQEITQEITQADCRHALQQRPVLRHEQQDARVCSEQGGSSKQTRSSTEQQETEAKAGAEAQAKTGAEASAEAEPYEALQFSAQAEFMQTCCEMMKNMEGPLRERACMLSGEQGSCARKRKRALAAESLRNVTTILFAANKMLYTEAQCDIDKAAPGPKRDFECSSSSSGARRPHCDDDAF